ncbi:MAG: phosphate-starvation-inducible PsiE family protein [Rubrobacter sp.]|nr:phosphate-starvation-inducible PsiE family protein [Rubrobacter sp.]
MHRDSEEASSSSGRGPRLAGILNFSEKIVYYGAAVALIVTVAILFVSVGQSLLAVFEEGPLETALTVLDRVLLIFIFVELLNTIEIIVRENEIVAEPFLLIGLIAVVRRILLVTAEAEQNLAPENFQNLVLELGVLTALVISLAGALYITRRMEGRRGMGRN